MNHEELSGYISQSYLGKLTPLESGKYDLLYQVNLDQLHEICLALRDDNRLKLDYFCNLSGIDRGEEFQAVYSIASISNKIRLDIKVILDRENPKLPSVQDIWPAANWYERELWELYGFHISGHENLTQFLLPDDWDQGYPMRKDWDAPDFIRMPEL